MTNFNRTIKWSSLVCNTPYSFIKLKSKQCQFDVCLALTFVKCCTTIVGYMQTAYSKMIFTPSVKCCPFLSFRSVREKMYTLLFFFLSIFGKWTSRSTNSLYSHFIIKLILYKIEILIPLTFSTQFSSHFLKPIPS